MIPKVYFDEAGNTGSNITNQVQPYFVLSSVCYTDDELQQIQKDVAYGNELHFMNIKSQWQGRDAIRRLLGHPLLDKNHVTFQIVDKTFATYAFMVDMLIDGGYGDNIPSTVVDCTSGDIEVIREGKGDVELLY